MIIGQVFCAFKLCCIFHVHLSQAALESRDRFFRAYAQSKSRARAGSSAYVMLIRDSEKCEFMEKLQEYKRIEQVHVPDGSFSL